MRQLSIFFTLLIALLSFETGICSQQMDAFNQCQKMMIKGDFQEAIDCFNDLESRYPQGELADDARRKCCEIYADELFDLNAAISCMKTLRTLYPNSRHALWAQRALQRLIPYQGKDAEAWQRFKYLQTRYAKLSVEQRLEGGKELIENYPEFRDIDKVYYWMGLEYWKAKDTKKAREYFEAIPYKFPHSKWAVTANEAVGDMLFERGEFEKSMEYYRKLYESENVNFHKTADIRIERAIRHIKRRYVSTVDIVLLVLVVLYMLWRIDSRSIQPKYLIFMLPWIALVAGIFIAAKLSLPYMDLKVKAFFINLAVASLPFYILLQVFILHGKPSRITPLIIPLIAILGQALIIIQVMHQMDLLYAIELPLERHGLSWFAKMFEFYKGLF